MTPSSEHNSASPPRPKALVAWSSGKDSAWALHLVRSAGPGGSGGSGGSGGEVDLVGLLTTITEAYGRVSMHGVREELAEAQAEALGLPLRKVFIPTPCSDEAYSSIMRRHMDEVASSGVTHVVHGDIALAGVREWREEKLAEVGLEGLFPLWGRDTASLAREMISAGLVARVTCLDPRKTPRELAGAVFDEEFLARLPEGVDPCGENGEFHTFATQCPGFDRRVAVEVGVTIEREGFVFTDLTLPGGGGGGGAGGGGPRTLKGPPPGGR